MPLVEHQAGRKETGYNSREVPIGTKGNKFFLQEHDAIIG